MPAPSDSDKGRVSSTDSQVEADGRFSSSCLAFHIILNLVVGFALVVFVPSHTMEQNVSSATSSLFWSSSIVGAPFVLIFILLKIWLTIYNYVRLVSMTSFSDCDCDVVNMYTSITWLLIVFLLTVELIVAILRSKCSVLAIPRCMGYILLLILLLLLLLLLL